MNSMPSKRYRTSGGFVGVASAFLRQRTVSLEGITQMRDQAGPRLPILRSRLMCNPGQSKGSQDGKELVDYLRGRIPTTWHYFIVGVD